jgi:hypothetical protein
VFLGEQSGIGEAVEVALAKDNMVKHSEGEVDNGWKDLL